MKCERCGGDVTQADDHVMTTEEVTRMLQAGEWVMGDGHSFFSCAPKLTDEDVLRRIVRDGLGGRREPGKDEL